MAIILTISLRSGDHIRSGARFNVTTTMPDGVWRAWRTLVHQRQSGEHVQVAVTLDGSPVGMWNADERWPRTSAEAIRQARKDHQEATTA